jgi:hypothetical protein
MIRIIVAATFALITATATTTAETALEVQAWCKPVVNAEQLENSMIHYKGTHDTGFCWGGFATIQELAHYEWDSGTTILRFCPPPTLSRLQFIKIFSKYVDDHPEQGHEGFSRVAMLALTSAFPCSVH